MPKRNPTKDNTLFLEWLNALPKEQRRPIKEKIMKECKITSEGTIDNWLYGNSGTGKSGIPVIYKEIINKIAGETVFEL